MNIDKYSGLREVLEGGLGVGVIECQEPQRKIRPLSHVMLRGLMRDFVIDKVKKPLRKAIITLANRYPLPTRENCLNQNSHILLDKRDEFLSYEGNSSPSKLFAALFRIFIAEYEHDPYYRSRINWLIEELVEETLDGKWLPRGKDRPINHWDEPKPFGLYEGRRFKKLINRGGINGRYKGNIQKRMEEFKGN